MPKTLIIAAITAATAFPTIGRADHCYEPALLDAAKSLHCALLDFESIACARPFPEHEKHYIHLMIEKSCRLVDGIKCGAPRGRVYGDFHVVKAFMFTVNLRLQQRCTARHDLSLQHRWYRAQTAFGEVACLIKPDYHHHHGCPCNHCAASPHLELSGQGEWVPRVDPRYRDRPVYPLPPEGQGRPGQPFLDETMEMRRPRDISFRGPRHIEARRYPIPERGVRRGGSELSSLLRLLVDALEDR